jgi:hypothetical protein
LPTGLAASSIQPLVVNFAGSASPPVNLYIK